MGPNGSFRSLCVLVDCNVFLCVLVSPNASLWVIVGPSKSVCVFDSLFGSL